MNQLSSHLYQLWSALRLADMLDILVVAILAYGALVWFKRARSRFVMIGLASLGVLYVNAQLLDMRLTQLLFQIGVTVGLLGAVVIFQEDIRRGFERIATGGLKTRTTGDPSSVIDIIVETTAMLARQKTGALIVIRGHEPLERHLTGGYPLDGIISAPLIASIFSTTSPGHDGAIIVDRAQLRRFAVHLPLATGTKGELGTRHTAALGLSERSDALIVVVSEERGAISVAHEGELNQVASASDLKRILVAFCASVSPLPDGGVVRHAAQLVTRNFALKALAIAVAAASWTLLIGPESKQVARTFGVPVVLSDFPGGLIVEEPRPLEARVTLSGSDRAFRLLEPERLILSVHGGELRAGLNRIALLDTDLEKPKDVSIQTIEPRTITVVAHETVTKVLAIKPQVVGQLRAGKLTGARADHTKVAVIMKRSDVGQINVIPTEAIELDSITETVDLERDLLFPQGTKPAPGAPTNVRVTVEVTSR